MIITLTTDFGLRDPFAGIMKGVIFGIAPDARVVDITHEAASYDVMEAAFLLHSAYSWFPLGTIHVAVVDPGVGTSRRPLAAAANGYYFVAPDNGVLSYVLDPDTAGGEPRVHRISNQKLFNRTAGRTFHGRDIFAPVAAHLARGVAIESVGPRITDCVMEPFPKPRANGEKLAATVLRVDRFGNVITNLRCDQLKSGFSLRIAGRSVTRLCATFADGLPGELFAIEGSTGFIEIALNRGSAADKLKVERGAEIEVESGLANQ
jgi:S-adenosylmethionine hydrolase